MLNNTERDTGLPVIGPAPWGSHFCIFYETKQDLLDILIPYFKAGLENNEACLSLVGRNEFRTVNDAKEVARRVLPDFDRLSKNGNIELSPPEKWFVENDYVDTSKAVFRFRKKLRDVLARGFEGLRLQGSSAWLRANGGQRQFYRYERELDSMLANQRAIFACTFPLMLSGAGQILDAARTHQFAVTLRHGVWKRVEIGDLEAARKEAIRVEPKLELLTYRQRQILQFVAEGRTTKEIAADLGISIKTVEAHRLQLMRRLEIDNIPGLVRFAVRTGLVSPEV